MFMQIEQTPAHVTQLPAEGSRALWSIESASTTGARGVVARWNCGEVPVMGIFVVEGTEATDTGTIDAGKALLLTARCK